MRDEEPILTGQTPTLEQLSIDELAYRIKDLEAEIQRCRDEIDRKTAQRSAADALFGGGD